MLENVLITHYVSFFQQKRPWFPDSNCSRKQAYCTLSTILQFLLIKEHLHT